MNLLDAACVGLTAGGIVVVSGRLGPIYYEHQAHITNAISIMRNGIKDCLELESSIMITVTKESFPSNIILTCAQRPGVVKGSLRGARIVSTTAQQRRQRYSVSQVIDNGKSCGWHDFITRL